MKKEIIGTIKKRNDGILYLKKICIKEIKGGALFEDMFNDSDYLDFSLKEFDSEHEVKQFIKNYLENLKGFFIKDINIDDIKII